LLKHKNHSYSSSLPELLLCIITLINTSNITRIKQTKYIKNKAEVIIRAEVFREALEATVALEAVVVSEKAEVVTNISYYLYVKKSVISITSQVTGQQSTLLKNRNKHIISLVNILLVFIKYSQLYIIRAF
jgi:hypothetical protein